MVASNIALNQINEHKPRTMDELKACKLDGFYEAKYIRFGNEFLKCVCDYLSPKDDNKIKGQPLEQIKTNKSQIASTSLLSRKRRNSCDLWDEDSDCDDAELSQIGDAVEKQLQTSNESNGNDALEDNSELDLLLADIEKVQKEIESEKTESPESIQPSPASPTKSPNIKVSSLVIQKKPIYQYEDSSDSSDDIDGSVSETFDKAPVLFKNPEPKSKTPPKKKRVLPSWMKKNY